ncbi:Scr1 family TA system antitoxin-like transcriptional regulator [Nocardiopsis aegyptia]
MRTGLVPLVGLEHPGGPWPPHRRRRLPRWLPTSHESDRVLFLQARLLLPEFRTSERSERFFVLTKTTEYLRYTAVCFGGLHVAAPALIASVENQKKRDISDVRFGQAIARARSRSGMTQLRVAGHLGYTKKFISQVECGWKRLDASRVRELDDLLEAGSRLVRLHEDLYAPEQVDWQEQLHVAELIRQYSGVLVPGNFQSKNYARAVFAAGAPWLKKDEIEQKMATRMERASRVLHEDGPQYHVVLDDVVVLRPIADDEVMREQIDKLIDLATSGRLQLQMYGWGTLPHAGPDGPFSLIATHSAPEVLHAESVYLGQTTDEPRMVRGFVSLFSRLQANARSVRASLDYLRQVRRKYEDDEGGLAQVELQRRGA